VSRDRVVFLVVLRCPIDALWQTGDFCLSEDAGVIDLFTLWRLDMATEALGLHKVFHDESTSLALALGSCKEVVDFAHMRHH
jgi:hypothetical protein